MPAITPLRARVESTAPVFGMIHLPALPGAPAFNGDRTAIRERALTDARRLEAGGVDAVILENFGDAPFYPESVPAHVVAEMTTVAAAVADTVDVPLGLNVLRNDAAAALSVAAAVGADCIRVNVHVGTAATDQAFSRAGLTRPCDCVSDSPPTLRFSRTSMSNTPPRLVRRASSTQPSKPSTAAAPTALSSRDQGQERKRRSTTSSASPAHSRTPLSSSAAASRPTPSATVSRQAQTA